MSKLLELINVAKRYDAFDREGVPYVLKNVSLKVDSGESVAIIGPSGSGKSTLLNIIGTLDRPTTGHVLLDGRDLSKLDEDELAMIRNRQIGFIFQLHHLLPQYTVLENVLIPTLANVRARHAVSLPKDDVEARARHLLERVGLRERLSYRPGRLSGGELQRVAVVRSLINQPRLLLADEPTGSLDRTTADNLARLLVELNRDEGVALILVTHSLDLAGRMARIMELKDGVLIPNQ